MQQNQKICKYRYIGVSCTEVVLQLASGCLFLRRGRYNNRKDQW